MRKLLAFLLLLPSLCLGQRFGTEADFGTDSSRSARLYSLSPSYVRTMGGGSYWSEIEPVWGRRVWDGADRVVASNQGRQIIWQFYSRPAWVMEDPGLGYYRTHVESVLARYHGKLWGMNPWNEPWYQGEHAYRIPGNSWQSMVTNLVELYKVAVPLARAYGVQVVGPEWSTFYHQESELFVKLAKAADCMPNVWSWHWYDLARYEPGVDSPLGDGVNYQKSLPNQVAFYKNLVGPRVKLAVTELGLPDSLSPGDNSRLATEAAVLYYQSGVDFVLVHNAAAYGQPWAGFTGASDVTVTPQLSAFLAVAKQFSPCPKRVAPTIGEFDAISGIGTTLAKRIYLYVIGKGYSRPE